MNIVDQIRDKLKKNELESGAFINLNKLMNEFNVSRTPIKESLIYLEAEGWVQRSGTHFIVTPLSLNRVREYTEIRVITEVETNVLAMRRINEEEMRQLDKIALNIKENSNNCSREKMIQLDLDFHLLLFSASKNKQLGNFLTRTLTQYQQFWLSVPDEIKPEYFFNGIEEIIMAIKEKNEKKLRIESSKHIKSTIPSVNIFA